jgi:outer membrane murein-binding lipoprotein Lpp
MGFLDKAKAAAEQAAAKAKEGVDEVQTKRELSQAYNDLGKTAFELIESGEVSHARLATIADRVRALTAKVESDGTEPEAGVGAPAADDSGQPPAMPT